jgi:hypothetical protein
MVLQMVDCFAEQLLESLFAGFVVHADSLPCIGWQRAQYASHLPAHGLHEIDFFCGIAVVVRQVCHPAIRVGVQKRRAVFGEDTFHALGEELFRIGEMANDFERAPFAGDRPSAKLVG